MILAKETTVWEGSLQPNHTYLMSEDMRKIFGYFKRNKANDFTMFKKPITIDKRYRTFQVIKKGIKDL